MALTMDPRDDLRWIEDELTKPMSSREREALVEARRRTVAAIAEQDLELEECTCGGIGCFDCVDADVFL